MTVKINGYSDGGKRLHVAFRGTWKSVSRALQFTNVRIADRFSIWSNWWREVVPIELPGKIPGYFQS